MKVPWGRDELKVHELRRRAFEILEPARPGDTASLVCDWFILSLIALNVVALALETVESLFEVAPRLFHWFDVFSVAVFSGEYVLRMWSCVCSGRYAAPLSGRVRYAATPLALIDLLAILPFYLPFLGVDLRFLRAARLFRIFRIAKVGRYSRSARLLGSVLREKREELGVALFVLFILLILSSSLLYFAEHEANPSDFSSIPAAMWWAVTTLTTVGYGDASPVTILGKVLASVVAILGIGMFALPTGILGAGFLEEVQKRRRAPKACPKCGENME